jgi:hypothetical protein
MSSKKNKDNKKEELKLRNSKSSSDEEMKV